MTKPAVAERVLVVEDDPRLRYTLVRTLGGAGYDVLEADTGAEALATVRALGVDLVVLDVALPDMSGAAVREALKSLEGRAPLVVHVSGVAVSEETQADALDAGADGYLTKPIAARTLVAHVNALLRLRDAERALLAQQREELQALTRGVQAPVPGGAEFTQILEARYAALLDRAVEQRALVMADEVSTGVRALAEDVVRHGVGAREIVQAHSQAVQSRMTGRTGARAKVAVEEGRLLLVQLLGEVCNRYRGLALGGEDA